MRGRWDLVMVVALGGMLGSLARWALAEAVPHAEGDFPWSTFAENVGGAFLMGVLMAFMAETLVRTRYVRPLLGTGFLGGFTTFSTYLLDTRTLLAADQPLTAFGYLGGTLLAGLPAVGLGLVLGRTLVAAGRRPRADRRSDR